MGQRRMQEGAMSRFTAYQRNLPPGCTDADGGASDTYVCSVCGDRFTQEEIDEDGGAFEHVCKECAEFEKDK